MSKEIRRVILCSGKVYYDLLEAREERGADDVYIMRLEQFYPWPLKSLMTELARFTNAELVWCQEEPKNMGGWTFVDPWLELTLAKLSISAKRARYVGRPASASTAAGLMSRHTRELKAFLADAFAPNKTWITPERSVWTKGWVRRGPNKEANDDRWPTS